MARSIEVVYENGVFRPTVPVRLEEGARLRLWIPYEDDGLTHEQRMKIMEEIQEEGRKAWDELSPEDQAFIEESLKRRS
jgi:predicted DNA-binding antitoxin AbrB/MazE fold protein